MANQAKTKIEKKVRCSFDITESEAQKLCELRCEPKPSTAAAQVVRIAIRRWRNEGMGER